MAVSRLEQLDDDPSGRLLALASARIDERVTQLVLELAADQPVVSEESISDKWLFLVLAFVFEHRHTFDDPLTVAEELYSDFGCPDQVAGFVRYMPFDGPDLGSLEANEAGMLHTWQAYLLHCEGQYKPS